MPLGKNPGFEGKTRSVGRDGDKVLVLGDYTRAGIEFLADDVAKHAALFVDEVLLGAFEFLGNLPWQNGQRNQLSVGMLERSAGGLTVVLKNQDVLEALVLPQVKDTIAKGPKDIFHAFIG